MTMNHYEKCASGGDLSLPKSGINGLLSFSTLLLLIIAQNPDWNTRFLWWGGVFLFIFSFLINSKGKVIIQKDYTLWICSFVFLCFVSSIWAVKVSLVTTTMKTLIVHLVLLLFLRSSIKSRKDIEKILYLILFSVVINSTYLLISNQSMFDAVGGADITIDRLGTSEGWNANGIGHTTSTGMILSLCFYKMSNTKKTRIFCLLVMALTMLVTLLTGSRTALIKVVLGLSVLMFLSSKGKRFKVVFLIAIVVFGIYYLMMSVPFFYSIIGWRMEGLEALITGVGEVDHSADIRNRFIQDAIERWKERPILGYGLNCYREVNTVRDNYYAHNNYAEILADLGIVGFITYYIGFVSTIIKLLVTKTKDNFKWLFVTFLIVFLISDYGTVSYASLLNGILLMLSFTYISCMKEDEGNHL